MFSKCLLPAFLFLSFTYSIDVSTPRSPDCEISASCFHSQKCQPPFQTITVTPKDSKVTSNCSIVTGGKVQDMTWQDLEKNLSASKTGLFLQQIDSKYGNESCRCFSIQYASKYFLSLPLLNLCWSKKHVAIFLSLVTWIIDAESNEGLLTFQRRFQFSLSTLYGKSNR